jgi:phospholipid/cholesterol/gamma-HCH transport system permease protein
MRFGNESQSVDIRADARGDHARLVPAGPFDLPHAAAVARAVNDMPPRLQAYKSIDVDLGHLDEIDGAGAVLLARLFDRLDASGRRTQIVDSTNPEAARLIALYRRHDERRPSGPTHAASMLARIGAVTGEIPDTLNAALDFTGYCASALPKVAVSPRSVDWRSLPRLLQEIGADGFVVTGAANLLVGLIIGLLGVSQLARFGAVAYVPQLVVLAQLRELGPLSPRSWSPAGRAPASRQVGDHESVGGNRCPAVDGIRPGAWLVIPRSVALVIATPPSARMIGALRWRSSAASPRRSRSPT